MSGNIPRLPASWFTLMDAGIVAGKEPVHTPMVTALKTLAVETLMFRLAQHTGATGGARVYPDHQRDNGTEWTPRMQARRRALNKGSSP